MNSELSISEALRLGVEAHKAGKIYEADKYYTAILKTQPNHPSANHNMGVLGAGLGDFEKAIPFFKKAIESNQSVQQYWLSLIDALIHLGRYPDATAILSQAKEQVSNNENFNELEKRLSSLDKASEVQDPPKAQLNAVLNLYQSQELEEALVLAKQILMEFPNSAVLLNLSGAIFAGLKKFDDAVKAYKKAIKLNPDNADYYFNMAKAYKVMSKTKDATKNYQKAIEIKPDFMEAHFNLGNIQKEQNKFDDAIKSYKQALSSNPDYAECFNNMGGCLFDKGELKAAINYFEKAIKIRPNFAKAYSNMADALQAMGQFEEALKTYEKALSIEPNSIETLNNMGTAMQRNGRLEDAVKIFKKVLLINPSSAIANNNMGIALQEQSKIDNAIIKYKNALSLKPDYADAAWNLSGVSTNIYEAKKSLSLCLNLNPDHIYAKLTLSALQFYEGDTNSFNKLMNTPFSSHPYMRSFKWVFSQPLLPKLHFHKWALFDDMISLCKTNRPFYEFGVWRGASFRYLISRLGKGYGFDTFEGLPENWHKEKAGKYSNDGNIPQIEGGRFIVGKFEDSLPKFFQVPRSTASLMNFDADMYSSTECALKFSRSVIDKETILIFDEFLMNEHWEEDEYKALKVFCDDNGFKYEVLAVSFFSKQAAIRLIGI